MPHWGFFALNLPSISPTAPDACVRSAISCGVVGNPRIGVAHQYSRMR